MPARLRSLGRILEHRILRFGTVGATGAVINLVVLFLGQEYLFAAIEPAGTRLNAALGLAILCATVNNFAWNRRWTWADRRLLHADKALAGHFLQYALACWLAIALQVGLTKWFVALHLHYLAANLTSMVMAGYLNFALNDLWAFGRRRLYLER